MLIRFTDIFYRFSRTCFSLKINHSRVKRNERMKTKSRDGPGLEPAAAVRTNPTTKIEFLKAGPLEAIFIIFGRRALIFLFESSWKIWKMTPLLCACAVVITWETQKCRKRAPRSVEFNFFINCDGQERFSQNERRRADLQEVASNFLIFA